MDDKSDLVYALYSVALQDTATMDITQTHYQSQEHPMKEGSITSTRFTIRLKLRVEKTHALKSWRHNDMP